MMHILYYNVLYIYIYIYIQYVFNFVLTSVAISVQEWNYTNFESCSTHSGIPMYFSIYSIIATHFTSLMLTNVCLKVYERVKVIANTPLNCLRTHSGLPNKRLKK